MDFSREIHDLVPCSLVSIAPFLRVASEIESDRPRVAYLCRFCAFEKAHILDPHSTGRGVRQFKTGLLQELERDNATSLASRVKKSDAQEIESYYQHYYTQNVRALDQGDQADKGQLKKVYETAGVLFQVLCAVKKESRNMAASSPDAGPTGLNRRLSRNTAITDFSREEFDHELVPCSLVSLVPFLRVANEIESDRPRVAYLCRFCAFEKAHILDPKSTGRGVRQFKTGLMQQLDRDNAASLAHRVKKSDAQEIKSYYQHYCTQYKRALDHGDQADRGQAGKAYQTGRVLYEVVCAVNKVDPEIITAGRDVHAFAAL